MFAPLLITFWLTSLVVALAWAGQLALGLTVAAGRLTISPARDLIALGDFGPRFGGSPCG